MLDLAPDKSEISSILNPGDASEDFDTEAALMFPNSSNSSPQKKANLEYKNFLRSKRVLLIILLILANSFQIYENFNLRLSYSDTLQSLEDLRIELQTLKELPSLTMPLNLFPL